MKRINCLCVSYLLILTCSVTITRPGRATDRLPFRLVQTDDESPQSPRGLSNLDLRIDELCQQIANGLTENQKTTIAVVEFVDLKGRVTDLGRFLAEKLTTRLYQTRKFKVIERQLLNKIVNEQKLSLTGIIDQSTAQRLGKLLGVDAIASGTVTDLGKTLDINARLINSQTAEIFAVASVEMIKDESVLKLLATGEEAPNSDEPKTQPDSKSTQKLEAEFFTFNLVQCRLSGGTVICDFVITNNDVERQLYLNAYESVVFDDLGNSYHAREAQLANSREAKAVLVSRVPTKAQIVFNGVSPKATRSPLLTLSFGVAKSESRFGRGQFFKVEFRNVPLREQRAN